jgi:hypothetical protein
MIFRPQTVILLQVSCFLFAPLCSAHLAPLPSPLATQSPYSCTIFLLFSDPHYPSSSLPNVPSSSSARTFLGPSSRLDSKCNGPSVMANSDKPDTKPQDLPRKFHEMFLLRAAEQGEGMQPKVRLVSSSLSGFVVDVQRSMGYTARTSGLLDKGTGTSRM